jgi:hypothetical protein
VVVVGLVAKAAREVMDEQAATVKEHTAGTGVSEAVLPQTVATEVLEVRVAPVGPVGVRGAEGRLCTILIYRSI